MDRDDRPLEAFLRQFQPRQPAPLPRRPPGRARYRWIPAGVAAAGVLAMLTASLLRQRPEDPTGELVMPGAALPLTIRGLSQATAWDIDALDALLLDTRVLALPDVEAPGGALRDLSRP